MIYEVYGISDCPACLRACADLMDNDLEYVFVNCDFSCKYRERVKDVFSWPTFPIITLNVDEEWEVIGDSEQLKHHLASISRL